MKKLKLTQGEIDKMVSVERLAVNPTVYGVGYNDVAFSTSINRKNVWQYKLWHSILARNPDVLCCDKWLSFANFLEWLNKEVGYKGKPEGLVLDKDIIVRGNKIYSPETCGFVPFMVDSVVNEYIKSIGDLPIGVTFNKERIKFQAFLKFCGKNLYLGGYDSPEEAGRIYKTAKETQIRAVANQYKDVLKPAVYESLMNWELEP